jgi:hypothetical protein
MAIAGIWKEGKGDKPPAFAMLTTEPGEDIEPYHNRQIVVLPPQDWAGRFSQHYPCGNTSKNAHPTGNCVGKSTGRLNQSAASRYSQMMQRAGV